MIVVMMVMWTSHVDVVHTRILHARSHLQRGISRSHLQENVASLSVADLCAVQLDRSIRIGVLCQLTQWRNRQIL